MATYLFVTSGRDDNRVALFDRDPRHPETEVFIAGDRVVKVAETPRVARYLREGRLVRVDLSPSDEEETETAPDPADSAPTESNGEEGDNPPETAPDSPVRDIKGIGPATEMALGKAGIFTVSDLVASDPGTEVEGLTAEQFLEFRDKAARLLE